MEPKPAILIDDRQVSWQIPALEKVGFEVKRRRMETADLVWATPFGTCGVEDKPFKALLTDVRSGRLNDQLERLAAKHSIPVLLLRDDGGEEPPGYHTIRFGRQLRGIIVADAEPDFGTAVRRMYDYTQIAGKPLKRPYIRHFPWSDEMSAPAEVVHSILQQVPRLSDRTKLAMRLGTNYSLISLLGFTKEQWECEGLSKLQATRLAELCKQLKGEV